MSLVADTAFVNQKFGCSRGTLFDSSNPYADVDRAVEDLSRYRVGDYKVADGGSGCSDQGSGCARPGSKAAPRVCDPNTRSNIQLAPGIYTLGLPQYTNLNFYGTATQPNNWDVFLVVRADQCARTSRTPTVFDGVTFDRVAVVLDLTGIPIPTDVFSSGAVPLVAFAGSVRFQSTSRLSITNRNPIPTTLPVSGSPGTRGFTSRTATMPLARAPPVHAQPGSTQLPGTPATVQPNTVVATQVRTGSDTHLNGDNQVDVTGFPLTAVDNHGTLELTAPDAVLDSGHLLVNDGGEITLKARSADQYPVAQITFLNPDPPGLSSIVFTTNGRVSFDQPQIDLRIGAATGDGVVAGSIATVDHRNGLSIDPASGQWVLAVPGQSPVLIDRSSGRVIDPNAGLVGDTLVDPVTGRILRPVGDFRPGIFTILRTRAAGVAAPTVVTTIIPPAVTGIVARTPGLLSSPLSDHHGASSDPPIHVGLGAGSVPAPIPTFGQPQFIQTQLRNVSAPTAAGFAPTVALADTDYYRFNLSNVVNILVTGQRSPSNTTGPIFGTDTWGSLITNGSTFELYKTITESYTHTKYDGTIFHVVADTRERGIGCGDVIITLPGAADWNGRVIKYKNLSSRGCKRKVYIQTTAPFDNDECLGCHLLLPPFAGIEIQNRLGIYVILSSYLPERRDRCFTECESTSSVVECPPQDKDHKADRRHRHKR